MRKPVIAGLMTICLSGVTLADDAWTPQERGEVASAARTALSLASYGEAKGDALAIVTAARIMAALPIEVEGTSEVSVETMLTKATELAPGDATIARIAEDVRTVAGGNPKGFRCWLELICYDNGYCAHYLTCRPAGHCANRCAHVARCDARGLSML